MVATSDLRPWVKNPRRNDAAVDVVADSIRRFGFGAPLLARLDGGEIIAGHTRLKAALKLGIDEVPVRYLDLDENEAHTLALADNRAGEIAEWDAAALAGLLREMEASDIGLGGIGWDAAALRDIIDATTPSDTDWSAGMGGLPTEDRQPFQQMTFTLHDDQAAVVARAIVVAGSMGGYDGKSQNSNGNALARVCDVFVARCAGG
jgi:hypothetical protein